MNDCIFCKIANKEIDSKVIEETENFLAFLDIHPHAPGHSLIIPKNHIVNLPDLNYQLGNEFIQITQQVVNLLSQALGTKDFTIGINEGPLAGRAVNHLHLHIIPRFVNDNGGSIHSVVYNPPEEALDDIYNKIKKIKNES